jgi:hypothetical protein
MSLKEKLGEELYGQVLAKLGEGAKLVDISDGSFIPKEKFDAVNSEKKSLEQQLTDRDQQLRELSAKAKGHEELSAKIADLLKVNEEAKQAFEAEKQKLKYEHTLENAIRDAGAKNPKAVKALLDTDSIKLDGDKLLGFEEQIKTLKEQEDYLFKGTEPNGGLQGTPPPGKGADLGGLPTKKNPFKQGPDFNLTEQGILFRENPELAKKLQAEAQ